MEPKLNDEPKIHALTDTCEAKDISEEFNSELMDMNNETLSAVESKNDENNAENTESPKSSNLRVMFSQTRSKSPVTVQEWVAALPDSSEDRIEEDKYVGEEVPVEEKDNLTLGAEGVHEIHFLNE